MRYDFLIPNVCLSIAIAKSLVLLGLVTYENETEKWKKTIPSFITIPISLYLVSSFISIPIIFISFLF